MKRSYLFFFTAQAVFCSALVFAFQGELLAQQPPQLPPPGQALAPDQLDDLIAPIALYPDPLLSQILVASTCTYRNTILLTSGGRLCTIRTQVGFTLLVTSGLASVSRSDYILAVAGEVGADGVGIPGGAGAPLLSITISFTGTISTPAETVA